MRRARRILPYLVAFALVVILLLQIDVRLIVQQIASADPLWLLAGAGCYLVTNLLRAYRFGALLRIEGLRGPWHILPEMLALSFLNNTLPARSGELSFPYFMRRRYGMPIGESSAALIVARIFDYVAVGVLYVAFALSEADMLAPDARTAVAIVSAVLVASLIPLMAAPWIGERAIGVLRWGLRRLPLEGGRIDTLIAGGGQRFVETLQRMRTRRSYLLTFGWSLVIWLLTFAWFGAFMHAIGVGLSYALTVVGATFGTLAKAIPFLTVGGFGAHEAGWTLGFSLVGMETEIAIASGFSVNILTLCSSIILGGGALVFLTISGSEEQAVL